MSVDASRHAPLTPDVEALVFDALHDLGGITVWSLGAQSPWPHVTDVVDVQVDVRASSKKRARDRAYEARRLMLLLPFTAAPVANVVVVGGPLWLADDDGAPRYSMTFAVTVRAARGT